MDKMDKDILAQNATLRERPYSVPEGYFEAFKAQAGRPVQETRPTLWARVAPYASLAAVFLSIFAVGSLIFDKDEIEISQEEYIYFSDGLITTYKIDASDQYAEAEIEDEDVIEYLIYSGITAEEIELSK